MWNLRVIFCVVVLVACSSGAAIEPDLVQDDKTPAHSEEDKSIDRKRRAYYPWADDTFSEYQKYESFSVWKPPVYQLSRPYIIPVYGVHGRIPLYFPPQPVNPFRGPPYLPPKVEPTASTSTQMPSFDNRVGIPDDDDKPIWGTSPPRTTTPGDVMPSFPPLIHDISKPFHLNAETDKYKPVIDEVFGKPDRPVTAKVLPPATTTTRRPPLTPPAVGPSNCVWAVITCCSASTEAYSQNCFEQRGCPGPFWGPSPCESSFAKSALDTVMKYYEAAGNRG